MADAPTQIGQYRQYQAFLYAPAGEDQHGISGTGLSMLTRFGADPWGEAQTLQIFLKVPRSKDGKR